MPSPSHYRAQAHRCLLLSRSTVDQQARLWLTDMANYYAEKARWVEEHGEEAPSLLAPAALPEVSAPSLSPG